MWILGADADEAAGKASIESMTALVTQHGGELTDAESWGRRTLSFPIKKNKEGTYFLAHFKMPQSQAPSFERALNADQGIIRYLLIIPDEPRPRKADSRRAGSSKAEGRTEGRSSEVRSESRPEASTPAAAS